MPYRSKDSQKSVKIYTKQSAKYNESGLNENCRLSYASMYIFLHI
jgi:hypothetical protein